MKTKLNQVNMEHIENIHNFLIYNIFNVSNTIYFHFLSKQKQELNHIATQMSPMRGAQMNTQSGQRMIIKNHHIGLSQLLLFYLERNLIVLIHDTLQRIIQVNTFLSF